MTFVSAFNPCVDTDSKMGVGCVTEIVAEPLAEPAVAEMLACPAATPVTEAV